jgi:hypothetical protein
VPCCLRHRDNRNRHEEREPELDDLRAVNGAAGAVVSRSYSEGGDCQPEHPQSILTLRDCSRFCGCGWVVPLEAREPIAARWLLASFSVQGQYCGAMEISELPLTLFVLPTAGDLVQIRIQRWALEWWDGELS